jgi:hypothetical protein
VGALVAAGLTVEVLDWDDRAVDWASYDRATDLRNPLSLIQWGLDEHHLAELAAAGVPITPDDVRRA